MDQHTLLQKQKDLDLGFEVSKILAQAGYRMEAPAFRITWGQVAESLAHVLAEYGLTPDRIEEALLLDLAQGGQKSLEDERALFLCDVLCLRFASTPGIAGLLEPPDIEDDEGPLTEAYENATRLGDDEGYWVDGGASADLFDE